MLKAKHKIRSILLVCLAMLATLILGLGSLFSMPQTTASAETTYVETSFGEGKFLITTTFDGKTYYLPTTTTSSAPAATEFTDVNSISEEHLWTVTASGSNYYIQNSGCNYLYTTSANNGVRVGSTEGTWTYDATNKSLQFTSTSRFLGIYNSQDWRSYTSVTASNYKESSTSFKFYKIDGGSSCDECSYNWSDWNTEDGTHSRIGVCKDCGGEQTESGTCEVTAEYVREGDQHTQTGTCSVCQASTSVTESCTLSYENVSNDDKTHNMTSTCSVCQQSVTTENVACTFEEALDGTTLTYTCQYCEYSYTEEATMHTVTYVVPDGVTAPEAVDVAEGYTTVLPAADDYQKYTFAGWVTEELTDTNTRPEFLKAGDEYTVTANVELYALYTYTQENTEAKETWNLVTDASTLAVGKQIVIAASTSNYALGTTQNNNNRAAVDITKGTDTVTINDTVQIITLETGTLTDTFAFNVGNGYLYAASSSSNYLKTKTTLDENGSWAITITADGVATIKAQGTYTRNWLRKNSSSALFACYESGQNDVSIYMKDDGAITYYTTSFVEEGGHSHTYDEGVVTTPTCTEEGYTTYTCECGDTYKDNYVDATGHSYEENITKEATCTEAGEKSFTCSACDDNYTEVIPANGHNFVDGVCSCGVEQSKKATLTFDDTSKRKDFSTTQQVWTENGITVTNEKGSSTTNVADYSNPVRFYKNSTVTIEYPGMLVIEIAADSSSYAEDLGNSIDKTTTQVQVDGSTVTLIFAEAQDSYTLTCSAQIRVNAITAYTTIANIDSASITVGENLTLNYYVTMPQFYATAPMTFTVDDKDYTVEGTPVEGRYVFSLEIPPHYMAENVAAKLIFNDTTIVQKDEYSIKTYTDNQLAKVEGSTDEKDIQLKALLNAITAYGVAAANYKAETNTAGENVIPEEANVFLLENADGVTEFGAWFTSANVWFDNTNKIMVSINTTENVTLSINGGEAVTVTSTTIYTKELLPTEFNDTYTFKLYYDGNLMQTLTYSVNSYAYKMQQNAQIGALAIALYNYGAAAETYATPLS